MVRTKPQSLIPVERIAAQIYVIRGQTVMLDKDLAELYGVETRVLVQAVKRNLERFPEDFLFQLSKKELENWRSQIVMSNPAAKMGLRRHPYAFTEHGVAMLASVLRSKRAAEVNIAIVRTFIRLRRMLATNEELARKVAQHDQEIGILFEHIQQLLMPPDPPKKKRRIGFNVTDDHK
jgi:ORF6N domain